MSGEGMRPLTEREAAVLARMAEALPAGHPARAEVATAMVSGTCGCGLCPTIDLSPAEGRDDGPREVLMSSLETGTILLFVDGGHLSCLELAPWADESVGSFPPPEEITDVRLT